MKRWLNCEPHRRNRRRITTSDDSCEANCAHRQPARLHSPAQPDPGLFVSVHHRVTFRNVSRLMNYFFKRMIAQASRPTSGQRDRVRPTVDVCSEVMIDRRENTIRRVFNGPVDDDRRQSPFGRRSDDSMTAAVSVCSHLVVGTIANNGVRLLDLLHDQLSDFLHLFGAHVFSESGQLIRQSDEIVIPKRRIRMITIPGDRHEAPRTRNNRRKQKKQHSTFFTVDRFAVNGVLHMDGTVHPEVVLRDQVDGFFAVDQATVNNLFGDEEAVPVQAVITKTSYVDMLQVGDEIEPPQVAAERPLSILDELGL